MLLFLLQAVFIQDPEVRNFLSDPVGSKKEKRQVIEELKDSANLSEHTLNFLKVLLQDGRLPDASIIFKNFENLYCQRTETEVWFQDFAPMHSLRRYKQIASREI